MRLIELDGYAPLRIRCRLRPDLMEICVAQVVLAVVSVLGKDQKGVVAQFATYMAQRGINIQDIEQRVVRDSS